MRLAAWSLASLFSLVLAPACSGKYTTIPDGDEQKNQIFDCSDYLACGVDTGCDGGECLSISGCRSAICVSASVVCDEACNSTQCAVLDSYPGQIPSCPDGTPIKGQGEGVSYPTPSGTGGGPTYAGSAPTAGGYSYPNGGYPNGGYPNGGYGSGGYGTAGYAAGGYGTAGTGNGPVLNCQNYARCNVNVLCAGAGFDCISIPGCSLGICAPAFALCNNLCSGECSVLESYPVQLSCSTSTITGYEGFDTGVGGTSQGGSPGNDAGQPGYAGFAGDFEHGGAP